MTRQEENEKITEAIEFFTEGKFRERKPYLEELIKNGSVSYNGFTFEKDLWCWKVWKPTDVGDKFKGEPIVKVIPDTIPLKNIPLVLDAQPWTYI